ncbi:beta-glucosidase [Acidiferrimicrobium sp. IK]|uniref:GH1 family beta-glucosidase n=1 Tax=Acidiferrimicrobium sp. IK TaxID=2871700 RepID=UPI0021CB536C|nr:GH1 family beta-glucosidase [Acidiferrimicrobium sp. IK]MCU4186720.1 beta-glucosidase [Acidiferrimicrobium sp. IK]
MTSSASSPAASSFPHGFLWGTSTASYQIEGAVGADGRGPSIWDTFSHRPGATHNGDTGDVACDHYNRLDTDLELLSELGAGSYRFSVAWPRVQPTGKGPANPAGLDFYKRLVDGLHQRDILPALTLYHWDLPQPLEDAGGWTVRDTAERFADYAAVVADALGESVGLWITLNEPWCSAWQGYGSGSHAPGRRDIGAAVAANHHLLLAHGLGVDVLRTSVPGAQVGVSLNVAPIRAATDHPDDVRAARLVDGNQNRLFTEPVFRGRYPEDMLEHYASHSPGFSVVADGDLEVISRPIDFLGVNFYFPQVVAAAARRREASGAGFGIPVAYNHVAEDLGVVGVFHPEADRTAMDWEIDPAGLVELLVGLHREYGPVPMYITENGAAFSDYVGPDGAVHDRDRIAYLDGHLSALRESIAAGVDLRGYFVWSLMDNFEWAHGYHKRFGLTWIDYPTGTRLPKDSFFWYRQVVTTNAVPPLLGAGPGEGAGGDEPPR